MKKKIWIKPNDKNSLQEKRGEEGKDMRRADMLLCWNYGPAFKA